MHPLESLAACGLFINQALSGYTRARTKDDGLQHADHNL